MGAVRNSRRQELAQLQLKLDLAGQLLDEIERRTGNGCMLDRSKTNAVDQISISISANTETRFAA
jgi:hypothetical protein